MSLLSGPYPLVQARYSVCCVEERGGGQKEGGVDMRREISTEWGSSPQRMEVLGMVLYCTFYYSGSLIVHSVLICKLIRVFLTLWQCSHTHSGRFVEFHHVD